ncbi:UbiD family decarboxylase [Legionella dresdenensis]|uniref:UbiD family decarboxylase n=1 Tax=Legionella dresdenensis TaxID=450200 RepID=A0ABV8CDR8_9GAMM
MPYNDLRDFLDRLREENELITVSRKVELAFEIGQAMQKSAAVSGPAILFENNGTPYSLVGGIYNSRKKALLAFEATEENVFSRILQGLAKPIAPILIENAPVHENIIHREDVDLAKLPVPQYSPGDGGAYITSAIVVSKDPETGITDMGNYRFQVISKNTLSFLAQPNHRFGKHIAKILKMGKTHYEAALVIAVDPLMVYGCQFQVSEDTDDFAFVGGLRQKAVELVKCKTIDLQVPAHAEFVIEISIDLAQTVFEGPLGEYTGYYTPGSNKPVATVRAITHRNNPIFQALLTGVPPTENHILKQLPFEASFYQRMKQLFPTIQKVAIPPSGGVSFYIVIAMEPRFSGEARQAMLAAIASNMRPKLVIVVNTDIDVQDPAQVEWALAFRMQPAEDVTLIENVPAGPLDPSVSDAIPLDQRLGSAIGIDATYPVGARVSSGDSNQTEETAAGQGLYFKVAEIPGWESYNFPELAEFLDKER